MHLNITPPSDRSTSSTKDLRFDDDIFLMAAALDPNFGFRWLADLPGSMQAKEELRQHITGIVFYYCAHNALLDTYNFYCYCFSFVTKLHLSLTILTTMRTEIVKE